MKINVSRMNQINGKLRVDNSNFKHYLGGKKSGGFELKTTKKDGKLGANLDQH